MAKALKSSDRLRVQIVITSWVTFCTIFCLVPLFITILNSFKSTGEIDTSIFLFPSFSTVFATLQENYVMAWNFLADELLSTVLLVAVGAIVDCILGAILGYIFTYKEFPFKETIFMVFLAVMMLPSIMGMPILVPFMKNVLNLGDTYIGYLLPNWAGGQVGALFLFRTFFGQQPKSIYESAQIEGATDGQILCKLTVPLAFPIILYKFVGTFGGLYNDYLWPSLILTNKFTVTLALYQARNSLSAGTNTDAMKGAIYAMYIISSIPLIFTSIISMKYFSGGDFAAGIKL